MKKFLVSLVVLAFVALFAVPAMADYNNFKITGSVEQYNGGTILSGDVVVKPNGEVKIGASDENGAFLSGSNISSASLKDTAKDPFGITGAVGITYGVVNSSYYIIGGKASYAAGVTAGGSFAYKNCNGFVKIAGEGSINHATYATNNKGSYAYTGGNAAYSYEGKTKGDFIAGGGVAATGGYSSITMTNNQVSLFTVSGSTATTSVTTGR